MRAAVFHQAGKPLTIEQVPDPRPAPDQVVLAVGNAGICGSDLHVTQHPGLMAPGTILGHEFAGTIVDVGSAVVGHWKIGDRVTALPIFACQRCDACSAGLPALCHQVLFSGNSLAAQGAYAEYVIARGSMLQALPAGVSFEDGAMVEPLAVGHHIVGMASMPTQASVLVLGGGPIGAAVVLFARLAGARHIVVSEPFPERRQRALMTGATAVVDPTIENLRDAFAAHAGRAPQVVFECVGIPGMLQLAIEQVGRRGRVVVAGVVFEEDRFQPLHALGKEVSIQYSQAYTEHDFERVIDVVARREIDPRPMHTKTVGFAELPEIFEALRKASPHCKVLIRP